MASTQKIIDEFTDLPVSRQRKRQLRLKRDGQCIICGRKLVTANHCAFHARAASHHSSKHNRKIRKKKNRELKITLIKTV